MRRIVLCLTLLAMTACMHPLTEPVETVPVPSIASSLSPEGQEAWNVDLKNMPCDEAIVRFARVTRTAALVPGNLPDFKVSGVFSGGTTAEVLQDICEACGYSCSVEHENLDGKGVVIVEASSTGG